MLFPISSTIFDPSGTRLLWIGNPGYGFECAQHRPRTCLERSLALVSRGYAGLLRPFAGGGTPRHQHRHLRLFSPLQRRRRQCGAHGNRRRRGLRSLPRSSDQGRIETVGQLSHRVLLPVLSGPDRRRPLLPHWWLPPRKGPRPRLGRSSVQISAPLGAPQDALQSHAERRS